MKKIQIVLLLLATLLQSQFLFSQKNIQGMIQAEKAFAAFTTAHGIKEGFLQYMDSAGLVFRDGVVLNAIETYKKQKPGTAILSWKPVFAVISSSGEMGVTTGPYELRAKSLQDTPIAKGSFSSIWKINARGEWKNILDLGTSYNTANPLMYQPADPAISAVSLPGGKTSSQSYKEVSNLDEQLNKAISEKNRTFINGLIATDSWLNFEGYSPIIGLQTVKTVLQNLPKGMMMQYLGGSVSAAKDFAYCYGTVILGTKKENYLRVWVYRKQHWEVILQTIKK